MKPNPNHNPDLNLSIDLVAYLNKSMKSELILTGKCMTELTDEISCSPGFALNWFWENIHAVKVVLVFSLKSAKQIHSFLIAMQFDHAKFWALRNYRKCQQEYPPMIQAANLHF